jgi:hypothetical protein
MARSTYVYVVSKILQGGSLVVLGTFTVKHEMLTSTLRLIDGGEIPARLRIHRYTDGRMHDGLEITEQFVWGT